MHYVVHADKVTTDSSTDLGTIAAATGGLSLRTRGGTPLQTSSRVFEHFPAPGNPGTEWVKMLVYAGE